MLGTSTHRLVPTHQKGRRRRPQQHIQPSRPRRQHQHAMRRKHHHRRQAAHRIQPLDPPAAPLAHPAAVRPRRSQTSSPSVPRPSKPKADARPSAHPARRTAEAVAEPPLHLRSSPLPKASPSQNRTPSMPCTMRHGSWRISPPPSATLIEPVLSARTLDCHSRPWVTSGAASAPGPSSFKSTRSHAHS